MALTSKKRARPTIPTPKPDADPLGIAKVVAEISPRLEEAYRAWLEALLRKFVLVGLEPAGAPPHRRRGHGAGAARHPRHHAYRLPARCVRICSRGRRIQDPRSEASPR